MSALRDAYLDPDALETEAELMQQIWENESLGLDLNDLKEICSLEDKY